MKELLIYTALVAGVIGVATPLVTTFMTNSTERGNALNQDANTRMTNLLGDVQAAIPAADGGQQGGQQGGQPPAL